MLQKEKSTIIYINFNIDPKGKIKYTRLIIEILINDSLETLSDLERKVVLSRYFEDLTQSETASLLGISQVKVS